MTSKFYDVVVVGAGQAGLSISYHLSLSKINHIILEQGKLGNAWREDRWDSFSLVTPNWSITLPGAEYSGNEPDGFMLGRDFVTHLEDWASSFKAPVLENTKVNKVKKNKNNFLLVTNKGTIECKQVVIATATYQEPRIPEIVKELPKDIFLLPAAKYRNPSMLPDGGVLVIGSGQSGCQIAEELNEEGRNTFLSVGRSGRLPRRYRGADSIKWQKDMGLLDRTPDALEHPKLRFRGDPHLSGARGGRTISLHQLRADGVHLVGRIESAKSTVISLFDDLESSIKTSDIYAAEFRRSVDEYLLEANRIAPQQTEMELLGEPKSDIERVTNRKTINLSSENIKTVIAATGFVFDFSWVEPAILDNYGYPVTSRGTTDVPGLYFMGLNWMAKRKSGIIYGVAEDADYLAPIIVSKTKNL